MDSVWMLVFVIACFCILGAIIEVRFVFRRRDERISEEMKDSIKED